MAGVEGSLVAWLAESEAAASWWLFGLPQTDVVLHGQDSLDDMSYSLLIGNQAEIVMP